MPWYLYLAFRQLFPEGKRLGNSFFLLSVLGVALGVAVLVVVQSIMGGFGMVHRERIVDTSGHLEITHGGQPMYQTEELVDALRQRADAVVVTPYAQGFVMAQNGNIPVFPFVMGIDIPESGAPVFALQNYLLSGNLQNFYDDTVLLSRTRANALGAWVGSRIEVYTPLMIEKMKADEILLPQSFEVVGIYDLEWNDDFTPGMFFTLRTMQDLYDLGDGVHGVAVRLQDNADEFVVAEQLREELAGRWRVMTWRERWADFLWVLDLEKTMMLFINLFIVAVAVFAIAVAQLLMVLRKTREIGLLGVIGAKRWQIPAIYCFQGFFIGVIGLALGIGGAVLLLSMRDPIITFLSEISGTRDTLIRYYYFAQLPVRYSASDFVIIGFSAVGLSTLASLLPAWRAARLKVADCMRTEQ